MKPIKLTPSVKQTLKESLLRALDKELDDLKMQDTSVKFSYDLKDVMKIDTEAVKKPIVYMLGNTYLKMLQYVLLSDSEIAWRGTVERKDHLFFVKDVFLYPQKVSGATVQEDHDEGQRWSDALPTEVFNTMRFQGHSHVNMGAFWSGPDKADQNAHLQTLLDDDYYIFAVMNKRQEILIEVYDLAQNVIFEKEDVTFKVFLNKDTLMTAIKDEINTYIKKPAYAQYSTPANTSSGIGVYRGGVYTGTRYDASNVLNDDFRQNYYGTYYGQNTTAPSTPTTPTIVKKSTNTVPKVKRHVVIEDKPNRSFMDEYPDYVGDSIKIRFNGKDYVVFVPFNAFTPFEISDLRKEGWKVREMPVPEDIIA